MNDKEYQKQILKAGDPSSRGAWDKYKEES